VSDLRLTELGSTGVWLRQFVQVGLSREVATAKLLMGSAFAIVGKCLATLMLARDLAIGMEHPVVGSQGTFLYELPFAYSTYEFPRIIIDHGFDRWRADPIPRLAAPYYQHQRCQIYFR
jgi:hypothetical protein